MVLCYPVRKRKAVVASFSESSRTAELGKEDAARLEAEVRSTDELQCSLESRWSTTTKCSTWSMELEAEQTSIEVVGLGPSEMLGEVEEGLSLGFGLALIRVRHSSCGGKSVRTGHCGKDELVWRPVTSCSSRYLSMAMARRQRNTVRLNATRVGLGMESRNGGRGCLGVSAWRGRRPAAHGPRCGEALRGHGH